MWEVNAPNEYRLTAYDLTDPTYWIYHKEGIGIREISALIQDYRIAKFDVFINGLYISNNDYMIEQTETDFFVKFIRSNFPALDGYDVPFTLNGGDDVKIEGDIETK
jgi:hypothetical protein